MNRGYALATWLMWLALPITALSYWQVWDQLPTRMAVHFDANWQPNGYTSREGALYLGLGIMAFLLVLNTVGALITRAMKPTASWPVLVVSYVVLGFCWFGNHSIVNFNLNPKPAHSELVGPNSPATRNSGGHSILQQ
jgi:amino acid transporter